MTPRGALVLGGTFLLGAVLAAQPGTGRDRADFVALDAVVDDGQGQPIGGLKPADFHVREDGRPMAIESVDEISATGPNDRRGVRTIVVLLDDSTVPRALTSRVQEIARRLVDRSGPSDQVSVVRQSSRADEATYGRSEALERIDGYRAGTLPFFGRETFENALARIAKLSKGFGAEEPRRHTIVCVGSPTVFDVKEPLELHASLLWPSWVNTLQEASRGNAAVYVIDATGNIGRFHTTGNDLVDRTGGRAFVNSNDFDRAVNQIWLEAGHYYMIGYRPLRTFRDLHDVEVTVDRPGARVHARRSRG